MSRATPFPGRVAAVLLASLALLAGALAGTARAADPPTVYAAASLTDVFPKISPSARFSFAGSNTLALQIRQGAPADVFASAAPNYTQELYRDGLVEKPRFLAYNRLVVIVPKDNPAGITSVYDLVNPGIKLVIANRAVPVGSYTRTVFRNLGITSALSNVVSQESDVRDVLGKIALGQGDAGVVYVTDARAAASRLKMVQIPVFAQPKVRYEIAVVKGARNATAARAFVARATGPVGRKLLAEAGFRFPPKTKPKPKPARRS
ncbi:MAG TPA: molybdate ABC transporter substrate-binding protein [Miltoncostaea sp.]|jgi:molybdate transport system substrate-binding protein|nr:molybdate ABC transporter substrate-binding protein [Miltoncostaea sp.]